MNGLIKNLIESFLHQHTSIMTCPHQGMVSFQQPLMARILPIILANAVIHMCSDYVGALCDFIILQ